MKTAIRKMGNSQGVLIPKPFLAKAGMMIGDEDIDIDIENHVITIRKMEKPLRQGWAEASKKIAEAADDRLVWPEFGNEDDRDLKW